MFKEKYIENWKRIIDELPIVHIHSRRAQLILKYHLVDLIRHREVKESKFPYKFKKFVFTPLP